MSYSILNISKTGLKSMQYKMDAVADELANANTYGYKRKDISFQELLINQISDNEVLLSENAAPAGINAGTRSSVGSIDFSQGSIQPSSGTFDLAIGGEGFFGVRDENNNLMLTRNGGFHLNEDMSISDDNGNFLDIDVVVAMEEWNMEDISIKPNGDIVNPSDEEDILLGRVILYNPSVLDSLIPLGEGNYLPSENTELYNSLNQEDGFGNVIQYALEGSNVEVSKSMTDMITTQRAYSLNGRAIQTTDSIMDMINNIKR